MIDLIGQTNVQKMYIFGSLGSGFVNRGWEVGRPPDIVPGTSCSGVSRKSGGITGPRVKSNTALGPGMPPWAT